MSLAQQMEEITRDLEEGVISDDLIIRVGDLIETEPEGFTQPVEKVMVMLRVALATDNASAGEHVHSAVLTAFTLGVLYGREHHRRGYNL